MNIDIESAILRCKEIVDNESDIIVDALMQVFKFFLKLNFNILKKNNY